MPRTVFEHALAEVLSLQELYFCDGGRGTDALLRAGGIIEEICEREGLSAGAASLGAALASSRAIEASEETDQEAHRAAAAAVQEGVGFAVQGAAVFGAVRLAGEVGRAIDAVVKEGLPPAFALAFDCIWQLLDGQMGWLERAGVVGGGEVVVEADMNCWKLTRPVEGEEAGGRVGDSFSKPHRDLRYDQCHSPETDALTAVSLWVPVNVSGAAESNGGMRCVSVEEDEFFYSPDHPSHMNTNVERAVGSGEVLTAAMGHACMWQPCLIHFGGKMRASSALEPRMSVAATFRNAGAARCEFRGNEGGGGGGGGGAVARMGGEGAGEEGPGPLSRVDLLELSLEKRLSYAAKAVLAYSHWSPGLPGCDLAAIARERGG